MKEFCRHHKLLIAICLKFGIDLTPDYDEYRYDDDEDVI